MCTVLVNSQEENTFHLTTEEYLHALISLTEELARLAVNSVTLGDYDRPLKISKFVKDLHAGFQTLNLKNDSLRKRSDSIKYNVSTDSPTEIVLLKSFRSKRSKMWSTIYRSVD